MLVKTKFSIKDLENLSGIKAHTIRIWEKRYQVLEPNRTDTNIRTYSLENLKHILNISFLYQNGYKISKIAKLNTEELGDLVTEMALTHQDEHALQLFKTAMFEFDQQLFANTYLSLLQTKSFPDIFTSIFIPLLTDLGFLWQTGTIDPCHERFVSEMIKQKIIANIEQLYSTTILSEAPSIALFLPYKEIHDIGIMYANYLCISKGINTIYLGSNISVSSLKQIVKHHTDIIFLTYLTVEPSDNTIVDFCKKYNNTFHASKKYDLWLTGSKINDSNPSQVPANVTLLYTIPELEAALENLKK